MVFWLATFLPCMGAVFHGLFGQAFPCANIVSLQSRGGPCASHGGRTLLLGRKTSDFQPSGRCVFSDIHTVFRKSFRLFPEPPGKRPLLQGLLGYKPNNSRRHQRIPILDIGFCRSSWPLHKYCLYCHLSGSPYNLEQEPGTP